MQATAIISSIGFNNDVKPSKYALLDFAIIHKPAAELRHKVIAIDNISIFAPNESVGKPYVLLTPEKPASIFATQSIFLAC